MAAKKTVAGGVAGTKANAAVRVKAKAGVRAVKAGSGKIAAAPGEQAANAVDAQLARYRSMRDFHVTAEPSGKATDGTLKTLPFCIQKHAASHLHYDFRLGWNGVLKSWAVAKGPSYFVGDKRLAVQVEDHPMEYGGFEGIIPAGQYGGGTVLLWDQGTWEPQAGHTDVEAGLKAGSLKIVMHGTKIKGKWALIRMGGKAAWGSKPNWLLIKEHDEFEHGKEDACVTVEEPLSVVTGRTMEQIAMSEDHVWNSKETAGTGQAWYRQLSKGEAEGEVVGGRAGAGAAGGQKSSNAGMERGALEALPAEKQPEFIAPQLASQASVPPSGAGWLHELKLDGYRVQARKDGARVQMLTRSGLDWTARMRDVAAEVAKLPVGKATLDGEVVVVSPDGTTSFADLQAAFREGAKNHLTYFCFDLLHLEGRNVRGLALRERKALLATVLAKADPAMVAVSEHIETGGEEMFRKACELHAEGIISKLASGRYAAGRGGDWLKLKCLHEQEFVIGGFTELSNGSRGVGSLILGYYEDGKLTYAGRTGTGFTGRTHKLVRDKLDGILQGATPFERPPAEARRGAAWVKPELVAQVRFATWTAGNLVRQAAFLGLREDKPAAEVRKEDAAPVMKGSGLRRTANAEAVKAAERLADKAAKSSAGTEDSAGSAGSAAAKAKPATAALTKTAAPKTLKLVPGKALEKAPVRLTHPDKVLEPYSGLTKQMLADYLWGAADRMLPHIADRPLSLVRCPEGAGQPCFFQKHVNHMLPKGVGSVDVVDRKTGKVEPYITLNTREALAGLAQMGVLEVHPWGSRNEDQERADRLIIDLDPDESLQWRVITAAAAEVRRKLKELGLTAFLKTTGGKGLHVVFPIEPEYEWPTVKEFAHRLVSAIERTNPKLYLTNMSKAARVGRIYLDYLRNDRGATSVAPYSTRAREGAPVSMPLEWSELGLAERPVFRVVDFAQWGGRLKRDPWKAIGETRQRLTEKMLREVGMKAPTA